MSRKKNSSDVYQIKVRTLVAILIGVGLGAIVAVFFLRRPLNQPFGQESSPAQSQLIEFPHVHGLGFSADGTGLYVPAHIGLIVYNDGTWVAPDIPKHDYMGYTAIDDGFFSSGHPDQRTEFPPLLGLVRSEDVGRTITSLAFSGESDFHLMAAGYYSHVVYVVNSAPNSQLTQGLFYTLDEGQTWEQSAAQGLESSPIQLAAHPTEAGTVAVASERGVYISTDYGDMFSLVSDSEPFTAVTFDPKGDRLLFGYHDLYARTMSSGAISPVSIPTLEADDAIFYIAISASTERMALATADKNIFLSEDSGESWNQIAAQGRVAS